MDISPLSDKQQRNHKRSNNRRSSTGDSTRLDEYSPIPHPPSPTTGEILSVNRINTLIDKLNQMAGSVDIAFNLKQITQHSPNNTVVEVVDSKQNELLLELKMQDLVEIEQQMNEDRVEDLTELVCGSFFSLTA